MNYKLSIVIPVFNKWNFTKSCLNDLMQLPEDHEIIVVDNGSSDETQEGLKAFPRVKVFRNEENLGFAKACNLGFSECSSMNLMFLNNDIRVKSNHTDWTNIIIESITDNCLIGPTGGYVDPSNNFQFVYETTDSNKKINYMSGWCLAASRAVWSKLWIPRNETYAGKGPPAQIFSEEFGLAYFEDTDLGFRAKKLKIDFKLIDIPVMHFGKISSGQLNTNALYSKARQIFINKWNSKT
jgi:GT2 family glycosyltransferase